MFNRKISQNQNLLQKLTGQRALLFSLLIVGALIAFEIFNFSTTEFAMTDLLGDLRFAGVRWSTILAIAFCGIDFAGIARLFTPEEGEDEPAEVWYLFSAWLLAAAMNAMLTWWGVSIAILQHQSLGSAVISREALLKGVPIFVALMVWLSRVLIIGTFSIAGERLFSPVDRPSYPTASWTAQPSRTRTIRQPQPRPISQPRPLTSTRYRPAPKPYSQPTYQETPMVAKSGQQGDHYTRK